MAVICTKDVDTNLSTANGFWRVEAYQLNTYNNTLIHALSSTRTINVTFANAGNLKKVGLLFTDQISFVGSSTYYDVIVTLKESGVTRASVTVTGEQIWNNIEYSATEYTVPYSNGNWFVFEGFNYPVTTTAGVWTLEIAQTGSGSRSLNIRTNGTDIAYFAACDNTVTAVSNADCVIADKVVTIDQSFAFRGVVQTGTLALSICGILCNAKTDDPDLTPRFIMDSPASSYTISFDGYFVISQHSGIRFGTEANPIPVAQKLTINVLPASAGGTSNSAIVTPYNLTGSFPSKGVFELWGEYPAVQEARLASIGAVGGTSIVTDVSTNWVAGQKIKIGGQSSTTTFFQTTGGWDETEYTITSVSGTTVNFSPALATYRRVIDGKVINIGCRGIALNNTVSSTTQQICSLSSFTRVRISGVDIGSQSFSFGGNGGPGGYLSGDLPAYRSYHRIENSSFYTISGHSQSNYISVGYLPLEGLAIENVSISRGNVSGGASFFQTKTNYFQKNLFKNITVLSVGTFFTFSTVTLKAATIENYYLERMIPGNNAPFILASANATVTGCEFYNLHNGTYGLLGLENAVDCTISNTKFNSGSYGIKARGTAIGILVGNCTFGDQQANTYDVGIESGIYSQIQFKDCAGNLTVDNTVVPMNTTEIGSRISVENDNQVANVDYNRYTIGDIYRTGTGLADTTVRTAGGYAMRFDPTLTGDPLEWQQNIPTGDITGKTMVVGVWVKINSANYWAGTHQMPRLYVEYDGGHSSTYGEAAQIAGDWQFVFTAFTPTTSDVQIKVKLTTMSSATGSDSYVYFDDFTAPLPQGVELNLGGLDQWAGALPVIPASLATSVSGADVWAAIPTTFGAGTVGQKVNDIKNDTGLIPATL